MFAAVEAGASVSNMISAYGGIRWGTGMSRAFQYEKTQSRIGQPPWDAPLQFIENSPIFWVKKVQTPYLTIHNDEDDAVPWYQGIEFFSAMRRLGKEAYMFIYNGEPHGLRNRDNMKHWTVHMDEFFDHYLLGKPTPEWMDEGRAVPRKGQARRQRALQAQDRIGVDADAARQVVPIQILRLPVDGSGNGDEELHIGTARQRGFAGCSPGGRGRQAPGARHVDRTDLLPARAGPDHGVAAPSRPGFSRAILFHESRP